MNPFYLRELEVSVFDKISLVVPTHDRRQNTGDVDGHDGFPT